jgi:hypothetical protein
MDREEKSISAGSDVGHQESAHRKQYLVEPIFTRS